MSVLMSTSNSASACCRSSKQSSASVCCSSRDDTSVCCSGNDVPIVTEEAATEPNQKGDEKGASTAKSRPAEEKPSRQRRIIRRNKDKGRNKSRSNNPNRIPDSILHNAELQRAIQSSGLPSDYNFEIFKTLHRCTPNPQQPKKTISHVALQMPEGLLMYANVLGDLIKRFAPSVSHITVLGDVTYGACCIDDLAARAIEADLLIHYGHSCLVPLTATVVPILYVFVEISLDVQHLVDSITHSLVTEQRRMGKPLEPQDGHQDLSLQLAVEADAHIDRQAPSLVLMGTIQFRPAVVRACQMLREKGYTCHVPQIKPLSSGEVLGCTSPSNLRDLSKLLIFVADGRFHLEAVMIANPSMEFWRYDPYGKCLTREVYNTTQMKSLRHKAIESARLNAHTFGIVLGTLGRQGNPAMLGRIKALLRKHKKETFILLLSELSPAKLALFTTVDAWVQVACPRLSIDWGHYFTKPVLSPYELEVCLGLTQWREIYPMDYYGRGEDADKKKSRSGTNTAKAPTTTWSNYHDDYKGRNIRRL